MYFVRKLKNWKIISLDYSLRIWIFLVVLAVIFFVLICKEFDVENLEISVVIPIILPYSLMLLAWICSTIISLKFIRNKKLKNNWKWILKKMKVTWIEALYKKKFSWCYLIFKDGNMTYYSDVIDWWVCHKNKGGKFMEYNWIFIRVWDVFDVYIDPKRPKNYWVDIDFLTEN
jgi:hypothetical protein